MIFLTNQPIAGEKSAFHRRRIKTEQKAKVIAVGWGTNWNAVQYLPFSCKVDLKKKKIWDTIHFGMVVVWYSVNQMIIHVSKHSFRQVAFIPFILCFKIILVENI